MRKIKLTRLLSVCLMLLTYSTLTAQSLATGQEAKYNPVITGVPFLTIAPDARHTAMGESGVATSADANAQFWNPAKYLFAPDQFGVSLSYTPWLRNLVDGINMAYLSGYYKIDANQTIGSSFRYFSMGDIQLADESGMMQTTVSPNEFAFDLSYTRRLSERWSGGVAFRYIRSDLFNGSSNGNVAGNAFGADISFYYLKNWKGGSNNLDKSIAYGIYLSNIGSKISYDEGLNKEFLPANMRLGAAYTTTLAENHTLAFSLDLNKLMVPTPSHNIETDSDGAIVVVPNDNSDESSIGGIFSSFGDAPGGFSEEMKEFNLSFGAEYLFKQQVAIRTGYFYENEMKGNRKFFSAGMGFKLKQFGIDLSYIIPTNSNSPLANTLRFSLLMNVETFAGK